MRVVVTGSNGMVGRCIRDISNRYPEHEFVFLHRRGGQHSVELTDKKQVLEYFSREQFDYIIHLAANVGGLYKNIEKNIDMFQDNILITMNILEACQRNNIHRGIFCLSSCIYPAEPSRFPMDETMIHEGPAHPTNEGYAYAKRMMEMLCRQYNKAYSTQFICVIPVNLYGPYDNFSLTDGHFIPMVMHRFHLDKRNPVAYGTGKPLRQMLYAPDFATIICKILFSDKCTDESIICCTDDEYTISYIVEQVGTVMGILPENIKWDQTKSDGCMKKTVTNRKLKSLFPEIEFTALREGLCKTYGWFQKHYIQ